MKINCIVHRCVASVYLCRHFQGRNGKKIGRIIPFILCIHRDEMRLYRNLTRPTMHRPENPCIKAVVLTYESRKDLLFQTFQKYRGCKPVLHGSSRNIPYNHSTPGLSKVFLPVHHVVQTGAYPGHQTGTLRMGLLKSIMGPHSTTEYRHRRLPGRAPLYSSEGGFTE